MKKPSLTLIKNPNPPAVPDTLDLTQISEEIQRRVSARQSNPNRSEPPPNIFVVNPDIDTPTLLAHACHNLALLTAMSATLAAQLERPNRSVLFAIQRLTVLAELLVNQALKNIRSSKSRIEPV
ncbi:DUF6124 family protein [Pseudomonas frederiksbergensis]|uniref:DUF3077 domain-containing protein n=1 Tax=Pseudomonas frederiksbergensis TaxID=104087 RepID=A0A423KKY9_9PSED|nr:hypothetical protein [Pseudomonas frederiksbergensis]RON54547.1 hypothetical protein BK665_09445 [Pseudomonas frederiksbergensis]